MVPATNRWVSGTGRQGRSCLLPRPCLPYIHSLLLPRLHPFLLRDSYEGVHVTNFHKSWSSGLAFCALLHKYRPDIIDFESLRCVWGVCV